MVQTMKREGHTALVHTAAASNLGQMLNRICLKDGIALVNIVRRQDQADLLRSQGAAIVCVTGAPSFEADLTASLIATKATIAFDATGGGTLAGTILKCMEAAIRRDATDFNRYGSTVHKQIYIYGGLDTSPTVFDRHSGMAWGIGGWLVFPYLDKLGEPAVAALKDRVVRELTTTFASHYTSEVSLADALSEDAIVAYGKRATGEKYLICPSRLG